MEETFQKLDSSELDLQRSSGAENGKEDCARKAQASKLTLVCWSRKESVGSDNPRTRRSESRLRAWQTLGSEVEGGNLGSGNPKLKEARLRQHSCLSGRNKMRVERRKDHDADACGRGRIRAIVGRQVECLWMHPETL